MRTAYLLLEINCKKNEVVGAMITSSNHLCTSTCFHEPVILANVVEAPGDNFLLAKDNLKQLIQMPGFKQLFELDIIKELIEE